MNFLEKLSALTEQLTSIAFSLGSVFSLPSLAVAFCVAVGFLGLRQWRRRGRVRVKALARAIFSRRLMLHRSTKADVGYFLVNSLAIGGLIGWACLSGGEVAKFARAALEGWFGAPTPAAAPEFVQRLGMTVFLFLAYEFGYWLDHYLKHRVPFLWEMHKTHHTAETLTPWTVWRVHPLDTLVFTNVLAIVVGGAAGVGTYLLGKDAPVYAIDGGNVILVFFIYAYVHLQHSQIWIPFTGTLGRVLMSPAHHQIHHSVDPAHFNSNLGSCLAVWDWLFGTLTVPQQESPRLKFGVEPRAADPHSVTELLIAPVSNALAALAPKPVQAPGQAVALDK